MTTPLALPQTRNTNPSGNFQIDSLLGGIKWGGPAGTGAELTYSFPWSSGDTALFEGYSGAAYSNNNEPSAAQHFGLNTLQKLAFEQALQAWANVAKISFSQVPDNAVSVGDIRVAFSSASSLASSWGYAIYPNSYWPNGGDIWINASEAASLNWSPSSFNYEALMHEVGHALGLKHPFEGGLILPSNVSNGLYTLMSYTNPGNNLFVKLVSNANGSTSWSSFSVYPETPMLLDIAAIQYLYGANMAYNADDTKYTFDPKVPFFKTIWDGGGNDTLSVANFSRPCLIDLTPGHFSNIATTLSDATTGYRWETLPPNPTYDALQNLGIAFNCIIENAEGGFGNDILKGNTANNGLSGGYGNDQIDGGDGIDTAIYDASLDDFSLKINRYTKTATVIDGKSLRFGVDSLSNIEKIQFGNLSFDLFNPKLTAVPEWNQNNNFLFDASYYLLSHPTLASSFSLQSAFNHYLSTGASLGYQPNAWFDPVFYATRWPDLKNAQLDAATLFQHYNLYGVWEGRSASAVWDQYDGARYLVSNPDVAAYVDSHLSTFLGSRINGALAHYLIYGADEGRIAFTTQGVAIEAAILIGAVG